MISPPPRAIPVLVGPFPQRVATDTSITSEALAAIPRPVHGGVSATNAKLAALLAERGIAHESIDMSSDSGVRSLRHHVSRLGRALGGFWRILSAPGHRRRYEMSLDGGSGLIYNIVLSAAARLRRAPLLLYHHSTSYVLADSLLMKSLIWVCGPDTTHIACSRRMFELYRDRYHIPDKFMVLSNAAWIPPSDVKQAPPDPTRVTLGYLGALWEEKGAARALATFEEIRRRGFPAKIVFAGGAISSSVRHALDEAQKTFGQDVQFLGSIPNAQKWQFFAGLDYFLFPTLYPHETQSSVAPEAMSAGVPVVALDHRFVGELIRPEGGLVVPTSQDFATAAADWILEATSVAARNERRRRTREHYAKLYADGSVQLETLIARMVDPA